MKKKVMIIDICKTFYRYDLEKPPVTWCNEFINSEYQYCKLGNKNVAGLFFFSDSMEIAVSLGNFASAKYKTSGYYFTTCSTSSPIRILDFSNCFNIYQMLCLLKDNNIDVLNDAFKMYDETCGEQKNTFSTLRNTFNQSEEETNNITKYTLIQRLKVHPASNFEDISLFGQRLTDFDNGVQFKKELVKIGVDGYRWREFGDNRGFSYCLLNSNKLTSPSNEFQNSSK